MQRILTILGLILAILSGTSLAQEKSVFVEEMTWQEVQAAIQAGASTAIFYAGSTEQNGPHMVTGKHNVVAHFVAEKIAGRLGNALVYPILPFAPTGDPVTKTDHMAYPGSVSISESTYSAIARDVSLSARAAGFRNIVLMGDHGGGQDVLGAVAKQLTAEWASDGTRVFHISDLYYRSFEMAETELRALGLKDGSHAGIIDTSELMFLDKDGRLVRAAKISAGTPGSGADGDSRLATKSLGQRFIQFKIESAVAQIRQLIGR